jgi:transposase
MKGPTAYVTERYRRSPMSLGRRKRKKKKQKTLWIETDRATHSPGHPFYERLNEILEKHGFDDFVEDLCKPFYAEKLGRPGIAPGVYFRMLMVGYFEGIQSERGIAWRCEDSLALRAFLGFDMTKDTPEHSSLSRIRNRIDLETHHEVFTWALKVLAEKGLLKGKTLGVDATTLEANAAMRSIVRRDTGENYEEFLTGLAKESGVETPTREDLARMDKKRKKTTSNKDWEHPHDPDAKVTKMKDGRTRMGHKAEHEVDLDTGAVLAVTVQHANLGDTTTVYETLIEGAEQLAKVSEACEDIDAEEPRELVTDKGYHSNDVLSDTADAGFRTYIPEPKRPRRNWKRKEKKVQEALYGNRRRIRGNRGKRLLRKRGELVERSFAHIYDTGGMRRTQLRGHPKILKRLLIHVCGFNLGLVMRQIFGSGKPKGLKKARFALIFESIYRALAFSSRISRRETGWAVFFEEISYLGIMQPVRAA